MNNLDIEFPVLSKEDKIKNNTEYLQYRLFSKMNPVYFKINEESYLFCESYKCILKVENESKDFNIKVLDTKTGKELGIVQCFYTPFFNNEIEKELSISLVHDITKCLLNRPKEEINWNSTYCESGLYVDPSKGEIEVITNCELREKLDE